MMIPVLALNRLSSGRDGFIVVAVLWILAALAALASICGLYVMNSMAAVSASSDAIIADPLVSAGVELAAYRLLSAQANTRPTAGEFTTRVGAARLVIAFQTEAARIDLNKASKELLGGLFVGLGVSPLDAGGYADRIIAWRTNINAQSGGVVAVDTDPEDSLYSSAGLSYLPRHGLFVHVSELWLVYGIPRDLIQHILPYVTVYSGQAQVDVKDAAPQVLAALPGMSPSALQTTLAERQLGPPDQQQQPLGDGVGPDATGQGAAPSPVQNAAAPSVNKVFRVGVQVEFNNGRRSAAEAVILLPDNGVAPYRVLSWHNALDGTADQPMDFGRR